MADLQTTLLNKKIHSEAQDLAEEYVKDFADKLIIQSKTYAILDGANEVQSNHIEKAKLSVLNSIQTKSKFKEILLLVGNALIGAGLAGIFSEYAAAKRPEWLIIYFAVFALGGIITSAIYISNKG